MIQYQSDYKPGRLNLIGQQKPDYLIQAIEYEDAAWKNYMDYIDKLESGYPIDRIIFNCLLNTAKQASNYTHQMYRRWCEEFNSKSKD